MEQLVAVGVSPFPTRSASASSVMDAVCGAVDVVVPHGVVLDLSGYAPVVHLRARTAFGSLTVRRG